LPDGFTAQPLADQLLARIATEALVDGRALDRARAVAAEDGQRVDRILLRLGLIEEADLLPVLCEVLAVDLLDGATAHIDPDLVRTLTRPYISARVIAPLTGPGPNIRIATTDPGNVALFEEIGFHLDRPVVPVGATTATIRKLLAELEAPQATGGSDAQVQRDAETMRRAETDGPVIRFVQEKLTDAVLQGASDLHVECTEDGYAVRFRLNGVLVPQRVDPALEATSVVARLKVMAGVNVAERRLPQDGRLEATIAGRKVDFRFSSLPTHFGESIVARVLDPKALRLGWDKLGFGADVVERIKTILDRPSGLFLVTGPTGSGKTTTLYTAVAHLNQPRRKIVTVEDPVEYNLRGVQQVQVQEEIGLSFARILRGVLRHDPNVILIGEIRDAETAEIAVRAAQVGRLVLSTLHTNSAAGALNRLVDLGVAEFLVRDVLRGVLGQELLLTPCAACGGAGCQTCGGTGVGGRRLTAELLEY
jgi:type II secretory ATPase GspE/PulE/Tfp pilus assembly ATPase PilB-like protein